MKVREMIAALQTMPLDADMGVVWDGAARSRCDIVWLAQSGSVLIADFNSPVYEDRDRPSWAPTSKQDRYWEPENPNGDEGSCE